MSGFSGSAEEHQVAWRRTNVSDKRHGSQGGNVRPWILPKEVWEEGLWPGIRSDADHPLQEYLGRTGVTKYSGAHNLKTSWTLCANLYFPFRRDRPMLASFLRDHVSPAVESVSAVELEYAEKPPLDPQTLLGEPKGQRGSGQTSPDVAFGVALRGGGTGLVLTECKYVEKSFYPCSGRKRENCNPDPERCMHFTRVYSDLASECWQLQWAAPSGDNRKYWSHLKVSEKGCRILRRCPAATAGYQLFRQQALAEALGKAGCYDTVVSSVAYDARNMTLVGCLRTTGIADFRKTWREVWDGQAQFATWTHQEWVDWVAEHDDKGRWQEWLAWVRERYDY